MSVDMYNKTLNMEKYIIGADPISEESKSSVAIRFIFKETMNGMEYKCNYCKNKIPCSVHNWGEQCEGEKEFHKNIDKVNKEIQKCMVECFIKFIIR